MRKVDNLGRIVIPKELRRKYGLGEGVDISFEDSGDGILVRPSGNPCNMCRKQLPPQSNYPLCDECIEKIIGEYTKKK